MQRPVGIGDDDIGIVANQRLCQLRHLLRRPDADINDEIAAFDEAARRQVGQYDRTDDAVVRCREHTHAPDPFRSFCICRRKYS